MSVLSAMDNNEKLPWYRDSQTEPPFRLTTYIKVRRVCSAPCHVLQRDSLTVRTSAMASNTVSCPYFLGVSPQYMMITLAMMTGLDL